MSDQADQLRRLVREAVQQNPALQPLPPVATISGGQRGVGATTVACLAATAVARLGHRVLLIDADVARPEVAERMPCVAAGTLGDVLSGRRRLCEAVGSAGANLSVLAGQGGDQPPPLSESARARLLAELTAQRETYDLVLIDAGVGATPWSDWLWQFARQVLLVTTATPPDLRAAYAAVKLARDWVDGPGRLRLVVCGGAEQEASAQAAAQFTLTCERYLGLALGKATILPDEGRSDALRQAVLDLAADLLSGASICQARLPRSGRRDIRGGSGDVRALGDEATIFM